MKIIDTIRCVTNRTVVDASEALPLGTVVRTKSHHEVFMLAWRGESRFWVRLFDGSLVGNTRSVDSWGIYTKFDDVFEILPNAAIITDYNDHIAILQDRES